MVGTRVKHVASFFILAAAMVLGGAVWSRQPRELRVCSDPDDLPFSNDKSEGFENKIAQLVANDLGDSLVNVWWPHRRGFVRMTIRGGLCDLIIGVPKGFDPVLTTKPYFRSTYYFVYRADRNLHIQSLDDTLLRHMKIGVNLIGYDYTNTPPAHALSSRGLVSNIVGFYTFYNEERDRPNDIIDAVAKDSIDVAIVWGPLAGYFAKREPVPMTLVALPDSDAKSGMPFAFDVAMGVRHSDKTFAAQIDSLLDRRRADIRNILASFNVPTTDAQP